MIMRLEVLIYVLLLQLHSLHLIDAQTLHCPGDPVSINCTRAVGFVLWSGSAFTGMCPDQNDTIRLDSMGQSASCGAFTATVTEFMPGQVANTIDSRLDFTAASDLNGAEIDCTDGTDLDVMAILQVAITPPESISAVFDRPAVNTDPVYTISWSPPSTTPDDVAMYMIDVQENECGNCTTTTVPAGVTSLTCSGWTARNQRCDLSVRAVSRACPNLMSTAATTTVLLRDFKSNIDEATQICSESLLTQEFAAEVSWTIPFTQTPCPSSTTCPQILREGVQLHYNGPVTDTLSFDETIMSQRILDLTNGTYTFTVTVESEAGTAVSDPAIVIVGSVISEIERAESCVDVRISDSCKEPPSMFSAQLYYESGECSSLPDDCQPTPNSNTVMSTDPSPLSANYGTCVPIEIQTELCYTTKLIYDNTVVWCSPRRSQSPESCLISPPSDGGVITNPTGMVPHGGVVTFSCSSAVHTLKGPASATCSLGVLSPGVTASTHSCKLAVWIYIVIVILILIIIAVVSFFVGLIVGWILRSRAIPMWLKIVAVIIVPLFVGIYIVRKCSSLPQPLASANKMRPSGNEITMMFKQGKSSHDEDTLELKSKRSGSSPQPPPPTEQPDQGGFYADPNSIKHEEGPTTGDLYAMPEKKGSKKKKKEEPIDNLPTYQDPSTIQHETVGGEMYAMVDKPKKGSKKGAQPTEEELQQMYAQPDKSKKQQNQGLTYADIDLTAAQRTTRVQENPPGQVTYSTVASKP